MSHRPQTLYGLEDSPVGLAAWMLDHDAASEAMIARVFSGQTEGLTRQDILENITLYWLTNRPSLTLTYSDLRGKQQQYYRPIARFIFLWLNGCCGNKRHVRLNYRQPFNAKNMPGSNMHKSHSTRLISTFIALFFAMVTTLEAQKRETVMSMQIHYRTVNVGGLNIFYREAGAKDAPVLLLLHGLPSSSRMFQSLMERLADSYHLIAPDYPGFGHSDWPEPKQFDYTFDHIARVIDDFTQTLGLAHYTLYMQDYGGPVGFRLALVHPERVQALIVQDAVSHNEGLGINWTTRRAFWVDRPAHEEALRKNLLSLAATKTRHVGDDPNVELYDPDLWTDEYAFLNSPGQAQIQSDLFYDYRTNVDAYPRWQAWMQKTQPPLLVIWGKHDLSFDPGEPERYRKDVPNAEVHVLDAGHFALDTKADEIAAIVRRFISAHVPAK